MASRSQGDVFVSGKVKFAMLHELSQFNKYSIVLYPDEESMKKVNELKTKGIKNEIKKDDDGYFIGFHRAPFIETKDGRNIPLGPPLVLNKEGGQDTALVGKGSDVIIQLDTYGGSGAKGKYMAARLTAVRIINLVPYGGQGEFPPGIERQVRGLAEQPIPLWD